MTYEIFETDLPGLASVPANALLAANALATTCMGDRRQLAKAAAFLLRPRAQQRLWLMSDEERAEGEGAEARAVVNRLRRRPGWLGAARALVKLAQTCRYMYAALQGNVLDAVRVVERHAAPANWPEDAQYWYGADTVPAPSGLLPPWHVPNIMVRNATMRLFTDDAVADIVDAMLTARSGRLCVHGGTSIDLHCRTDQWRGPRHHSIFTHDVTFRLTNDLTMRLDTAPAGAKDGQPFACMFLASDTPRIVVVDFARCLRAAGWQAVISV